MFILHDPIFSAYNEASAMCASFTSPVRSMTMDSCSLHSIMGADKTMYSSKAPLPCASWHCIRKSSRICRWPYVLVSVLCLMLRKIAGFTIAIVLEDRSCLEAKTTGVAGSNLTRCVDVVVHPHPCSWSDFTF